MYQWVLIGHIVSIISWMAGLFYLPRLFVYHVDAGKGSDLSETFKIMERRLLKAIMTPAMLSSWIFGLWLAVLGAHYDSRWFYIKILLVVLMSIFHMMCGKWRKDFLVDKNRYSSRFYRIANEVPTILMIFIVILVIIKPF